MLRFYATPTENGFSAGIIYTCAVFFGYVFENAEAKPIDAGFTGALLNVFISVSAEFLVFNRSKFTQMVTRKKLKSDDDEESTTTPVQTPDWDAPNTKRFGENKLTISLLNRMMEGFPEPIRSVQARALYFESLSLTFHPMQLFQIARIQRDVPPKRLCNHPSCCRGPTGHQRSNERVGVSPSNCPWHSVVVLYVPCILLTIEKFGLMLHVLFSQTNPSGTLALFGTAQNNMGHAKCIPIQRGKDRRRRHGTSLNRSPIQVSYSTRQLTSFKDPDLLELTATEMNFRSTFDAPNESIVKRRSTLALKLEDMGISKSQLASSKALGMEHALESIPKEQRLSTIIKQEAIEASKQGL